VTVYCLFVISPLIGVYHVHVFQISFWRVRPCCSTSTGEICFSVTSGGNCPPPLRTWKCIYPVLCFSLEDNSLNSLLYRNKSSTQKLLIPWITLYRDSLIDWFAFLQMWIRSIEWLTSIFRWGTLLASPPVVVCWWPMDELVRQLHHNSLMPPVSSR
jgi:hypothetical protein